MRQVSGESEEADSRQMYSAVCSDCGQNCEVPFEPTEGKPVRCKDCYLKNRRKFSGGGRGRSFGGPRDGPREMHDAVCSECGQACQVPFKPTAGKPVKCRECWSAGRKDF